MVERQGLDDSEGTGNVCWAKADLRVPSEAIAGAEKVRHRAHVDVDIPPRPALLSLHFAT